jgi:protein-disulfide isomerase
MTPRVARSRRTLLAIAAGTALVVTAALIAASHFGGGGDPAPSAPLAGTTLLDGIPQHGNVLGAPDAPVTLVEYADLQCPYCAQYANDVLPALIRSYVRPGHVRLVFRGLAFIGPDSETALRAVVAGGEQNRLWDVLHLLYASQGAENSGWVTRDLLRSVAASIPSLDADRLLADADGDGVAQTLAGFERAAAADAVDSTPSFTVGPTGGRLAPLHVAALDPAAFAPTLDGLLGA